MTLGLFRTLSTIALPTLRELTTLMQSSNFSTIRQALQKVDVLKVEYNGLLHVAAVHGQADVVNYLLDKGIDVDQRYTAMADQLKATNQGPTAVFAASFGGQHTVLELLLNKGGNPNLSCTFIPGDIYHSNIAPLHQSAVRGDVKLAALLLKHKANVDPRSNAGETPLLHACWKGHLPMMDLLLDHGADPTISSTEGKVLTPLVFIEASTTLRHRYRERLVESKSRNPFGK